MHQFSCPYTTQQNGLVERKYRHIIESSLSMVFQAKLHLTQRSSAVNTAIFLINRLPSIVLFLFGKFFFNLNQTCPNSKSLVALLSNTNSNLEPLLAFSWATLLIVKVIFALTLLQAKFTYLDMSFLMKWANHHFHTESPALPLSLLNLGYH